MTLPARVRAAVAHSGLAAVGTSGAGFLGALPESARVACVLAGGWVLPAVLFMPAARRVTGASLAASFALSLFSVLSLHAIVSESFRLAGASFWTYSDALTWLLLIGFGAMFAVASKRSRPRGTRRPRRWRVVSSSLAVLGLLAIAATSRGGFTVDEDAFDHIGFVRRVIDTGSMRPDHVLAWPSDAGQPLPPDPRKGALHPNVAWVASLAGASPAVVFSMLPLVLYPGFVLAFVAFSRVLLPTRHALAWCVGLFLLSYGGTAFQLAHASAYGQNISAAFYWILAAVALRPYSRPRLAAMTLLAFGGALVHVGVALHMAVLAVTLVGFARWLGRDYREAMTPALVLVASAGAGVLLRLGFSGTDANVIHTHVQGVLFVADEAFVMSPMEILRQFGMVYL